MKNEFFSRFVLGILAFLLLGINAVAQNESSVFDNSPTESTTEVTDTGETTSSQEKRLWAKIKQAAGGRKWRPFYDYDKLVASLKEGDQILKVRETRKSAFSRFIERFLEGVFEEAGKTVFQRLRSGQSEASSAEEDNS